MRGSADHPVDPGVESVLNSGAAPAAHDRPPVDAEPEAGGYAAGEAAFLALQSEPASVGLARRFVRGWLGSLATSTFGDDLQLVASELVTNAIRHSALSALRISRRERCVLIEVDDENGGEPLPDRQLEATASSGRGLLIIERLVTRWGWNPLPGGGKRVWCELCPDFATS